MKKTISLLLSLCMLLALISSCSQPQDTPTQTPDPSPSLEVTDQPADSPAPAEAVHINIAVLAGPTGIGAVKLMQDSDDGATENTYEFTVATANDEITGKLVSGELDIAAVATNLASNLYQQTDGELQMLAINTLSVLYLVENGETIQSISDLKGKTIHAMGQGANPEYVLRHLLTENGIDPDTDVAIEFGTPEEIQTGLATGDFEIGILGMPAAMGAVMKGETARIALDLGALWNDGATEGELAMGCLMVRRSFAEENPETIAQFLVEYAASVAYVNDSPEEAAELVAQYGITPNAGIAKASIPYCNLVCITGADMEPVMGGYYQVLFDANPKSIGGTVPDADFYYVS